MKQSSYISFFIILQMLIGFGIMPIFVLDALLGYKAVIVFHMTSLLIICVYGLRLWFNEPKSAQPNTQPQYNTAAVNALGFGLVFAFIMAEIVAVVLVTKI